MTGVLNFSKILTVKTKCIKHIRKSVIARYTKHYVHLGINHATSVLISTFVDIIFAFLEKRYTHFRL